MDMAWAGKRYFSYPHIDMTKTCNTTWVSRNILNGCPISGHDMGRTWREQQDGRKLCEYGLCHIQVQLDYAIYYTGLVGLCHIQVQLDYAIYRFSWIMPYTGLVGLCHILYRFSWIMPSTVSSTCGVSLDCILIIQGGRTWSQTCDSTHQWLEYRKW